MLQPTQEKVLEKIDFNADEGSSLLKEIHPAAAMSTWARLQAGNEREDPLH